MTRVAAAVFLPLLSVLLGGGVILATLLVPHGAPLRAAGQAYLGFALLALALSVPLAREVARRMVTWQDRLTIPTGFDVRRRGGLVVFVRG